MDQSAWPSTDDWIRKIQHIQYVVLSAIKKEKRIFSFAIIRGTAIHYAS